MERIKNLVVFCVYISLTVLVCSFIPSLFPETQGATQAYSHMQSQYVKIAENSSVDVEAMKNVISEEEFTSGISSDTVHERAKTLFMETQNYIYIYGEEALTEIADEVVLIYETEQEIAKDSQRVELLQQIRMISLIVLCLSVTIVALIIYIQRKNKKIVEQPQR